MWFVIWRKPEPPEPDDDGDPEAIFCRWCRLPRWHIHDSYLCRICDNPTTTKE